MAVLDCRGGQSVQKANSEATEVRSLRCVRQVGDGMMPNRRSGGDRHSGFDARKIESHESEN